MEVYEKVINITRQIQPNPEDLIKYYRALTTKCIDEDEYVVRFVISKGEGTLHYQVSETLELGILKLNPNEFVAPNIFKFYPRKQKRETDFNIVFIIPTGIGAEIGGHSGDGGATARLFASVCDNFITHPNVVNASDINELPENGLYVEGSVLSRFLLGEIGLYKSRSNRICIVINNHTNRMINRAVNAINAARANMGINITTMIKSDFDMRSEFTNSGRATGTVSRLENLIRELKDKKDEYDAIVVTSPIELDINTIDDYFSDRIEVNPWGGAEAILTHTISNLVGKPAVHAPMPQVKEELELDKGASIVNPTKAAESVSLTNLHCILKGAHRMPKIGSPYTADLSIEDIDCIIMPFGCFGLPTIASAIHKIPLIVVQENRNIMQYKYTGEIQPYLARDYKEALWIVCALRAGISLSTLKRPMIDFWRYR